MLHEFTNNDNNSHDNILIYVHETLYSSRPNDIIYFQNR